MRAARTGAISLVVCGVLAVAAPATSSASICGLVGWFNGAAGKACGVVTKPDKLIGVGKKLATGHVGSAAKSILGVGGGGGGGSKAAALIGLAAIGTWVIGGAKTALSDTAKVLDKTTDPRLTATWFSSTYWRMAGIAAVLTLPFLFAAAVQALMRSDLALLARAALGYLPLSLLAVSIAAPLTMLLLAACDEMSSIVSSAAGHSGVHFLSRMTTLTGGLVALTSPFLAFLIGLLTAAGAITLWIEMLMREAAVYIVVLMLPLAFAALAWPARRVWAIRATEMLVALILSKFAVIAVLALGGAALSQTTGATGLLTGLVLVVLGAFAPWALVRLLPLAEIASGAAGQLRGGLSSARRTMSAADEGVGRAENWGGTISAGMRRQMETMSASVFGRSSSAEGGRAEIDKLALPAGREELDDGDEAIEETDPLPSREPVMARPAGERSVGEAATGGTRGQTAPPPDPLMDSLASKEEWPPIVGSAEAIAAARPIWEFEDEPAPDVGDDDPLPPEPDPSDGRP